VEIRGNGVTVLLVSYVNGMYVVKLGEWTHQPLLSFEAKLNLGPAIHCRCYEQV